jgi:methylthioribose-1-phosphate isomerase
MIDEDHTICRAIGEHGLAFLRDLRAKQHLHGKDQGGRMKDEQEPAPSSSDSSFQILTHCNAGGLATAGYGTALAPVYVGAEHGLHFHVFSDETRPLLQGSRITAYELQKNGIPVTVICDNMAAAVMSQKRVDAVLVGTDRVAANGDVANKIGTLNVAILAKYFHVPFLVAAPTSSIDLAIDSGAQIPIEQRDPAEIANGMGKQTAPPDVAFYNPAFDVTPASLVTAIITEHGIAHPPYEKSLAALCAKSRYGSNAAARRDRH